LGIATKLRMPWSVCAGGGYSNRVDRQEKATQGYEKGWFELLLGGVHGAAARKNAVRWIFIGSFGVRVIREQTL